MVKIFGLTKKKKTANPEPEHKLTSPENDPQKMSPFIAGMNEYMERYGNLVRNAATWRRISFLLGLLCALCVISVVIFAQSVKTVPFIVQVDRHGYEIAVKPVEPSGIDDKLIISRLGRFITCLKSILNDDIAQVTYIDFTYKSIPNTSPAYKKLLNFYERNNPLAAAAAGKNTVLVNLKSILPLGESGKTWRGEWEENHFSGGALSSVKSFTGIFEIQITPPTTMKEIMDNPLGLFVTNFDITEELKK
jgi:type IV secretion system protein VirB5